MRRSVIALIGFGLLSIAMPAAADPTTIHVRVTPADLESREAVAQLYGRVDAAADAVCREILRGSTPAYPSLRTCKRTLIDRALEDSRYAEVVAYHAELRGRPLETTTVASR